MACARLHRRKLAARLLERLQRLIARRRLAGELEQRVHLVEPRVELRQFGRHGVAVCDGRRERASLPSCARSSRSRSSSGHCVCMVSHRPQAAARCLHRNASCPCSPSTRSLVVLMGSCNDVLQSGPQFQWLVKLAGDLRHANEYAAAAGRGELPDHWLLKPSAADALGIDAVVPVASMTRDGRDVTPNYGKVQGANSGSTTHDSCSCCTARASCAAACRRGRCQASCARRCASFGSCTPTSRTRATGLISSGSTIGTNHTPTCCQRPISTNPIGRQCTLRTRGRGRSSATCARPSRTATCGAATSSSRGGLLRLALAVEFHASNVDSMDERLVPTLCGEMRWCTAAPFEPADIQTMFHCCPWAYTDPGGVASSCDALRAFQQNVRAAVVDGASTPLGCQILHPIKLYHDATPRGPRFTDLWANKENTDPCLREARERACGQRGGLEARLGVRGLLQRQGIMPRELRPSRRHPLPLHVQRRERPLRGLDETDIVLVTNEPVTSASTLFFLFIINLRSACVSRYLSHHHDSRHTRPPPLLPPARSGSASRRRASSQWARCRWR